VKLGHIYCIRYIQIIFYHVYVTDAGRNSTLSATHPPSIRNLETMALDYMRVFRRETTTAVSILFSPLNNFCAAQVSIFPTEYHSTVFSSIYHAGYTLFCMPKRLPVGYTRGIQSHFYTICAPCQLWHFFNTIVPSALWHCWLSSRKGIRPVKMDGGGGHWLVRMEWHPTGWSVCLPLFIFPCP